MVSTTNSGSINNGSGNAGELDTSPVIANNKIPKVTVSYLLTN